MRIFKVLLLTWGLSAVLAAQPVVDQINKTITQQEIKAHLSFLASDALEGRETGKAGIEVAAQYLSSYFMGLGLDTLSGMKGFRQVVPFSTFSPPDSAYAAIDGQLLRFSEDFIVLNGSKTTISAEPIFVGHATTEELEGKDLRFKLAVSYCGDGQNSDVRYWMEHSRDKYARVQKAGAVGLVEIYQNASLPWNFLKRLGTSEQTSLSNNNVKAGSLPHLWIGSTDTTLLKKLIYPKKSLSLYMEEVKRKGFTSDNIVAMIEGTDPELKEEFVVFSAHYDHVGIGRPDVTGDTVYNGARDNATGTTAIMALAKYFAQYPPKRSSLFVLFTAEEKGLLGSQWFVENSPVPLDKIKYCFNIDNGGYNDTTIVSVIGLTRTTVQEDISAASAAFGLEAIEDSAGEQGLFDRSDNVNFAKKGIPAPTFSLGFRAFDQEIFKYYHQPSDEVSSLNFNYIEKYVKAYIYSSDKIANTTQPIFWKTGDKYFSAGVELYKMDK